MADKLDNFSPINHLAERFNLPIKACEACNGKGRIFTWVIDFPASYECSSCDGLGYIDTMS